MSEQPYRDRPCTTHTDGTPLFQNQNDRDNEMDVAKTIEEAWGCELHRFGLLAPLDFYATKHDRMAAVLEVKCRSHEVARFPTVFLNVRKWLALGLAQTGMGVPAVFVVRFSDELRFIRWDDIAAHRLSIAGCAARVKSDSDIEPVISVPVGSMSPVVKTTQEG